MHSRIDLLEKLKRALVEKLPGMDSQYKMAPGIRMENQHDTYRNAAVLILLYIREDIWHIVLIKRAEYPGVHSNQVSLPGGKHEESDTDLEMTAMRETREELGIEDSNIQLLGKLSKLEIPVSGIEVTPFVGVYPDEPDFHPEPAEVAYIIEVPLRNLLSEETTEKEVRTILCNIVNVPYFKIGNEKVWGATAMILSEFLDVVRNLEGVDPQ